eukprot:scaffold7145_cov215-Skeletonema_dohrnii-CCMP3373.AAC.3
MPSQVRKFSFPRSNSKRKSPQQNGRAAKSNDTEGGFIREAILPEKLRRLQNPNINLDNVARKKPVPTQPHRSETDTMNNPYRKRKKPSSIWHQILDSNDATSKGNNNSDDKKPKVKRNWDDMEKEMIESFNTNAASKQCTSCKSTNIEIVGNSTSRNSDSMTKGEVWGMKDRGETVVERCRCLNCGRIWNED